MEKIFPVTALQKKQGEVKKAARNDIVRITENGKGAFVFCSDEIFEEKIREAADRAAYEERVACAFERGFASIKGKRCFDNVEDARQAAIKQRKKRA